MFFGMFFFKCFLECFFQVYSLHRKLSGLFLLAGKLEAEFNCFVIWEEIRAAFKPFPEDQAN